MQKIGLAIHGGAGTITRAFLTPEKEQEYKAALEEALRKGYEVIEKGGKSIDAVQQAVVILENNPLFNAGRGSVFTSDGKNEMDASIMEGKELKAGAVADIRNIKNPIELARTVMDKSVHVFLSGKGAERFAKESGIAFENDEYFFCQDKYDQMIKARREKSVYLDHSAEEKFGTVGAVAVDREGNLAAATSTGGMTNKKFGRVGDSPMIGAGTYANNKTCAISCTGHGEFFIRNVVAYDISCLMEYKGLTLEEAANVVVNEKLKKQGGEGGIIGADAKGNLSLVFNSEGMYRGFKKEDGDFNVAVYK